MPLRKRAYYIVNGISVYRIVAAPLLLVFVITREMELFKWLLLVSFSTDAIDGYIARKFKVTSMLGAKLDSIGDDLTVLVAVIALCIAFPTFIIQHIVIVIVLAALFILQTLLAFFRYGKMTSFHTYAAKVSALLQGLFLLSAFFLEQPHVILFYIGSFVTALDVTEEIILVLMLKKWRANVHSLWVVLNKKSR
jgi:cardiolipin synthase